MRLHQLADDREAEAAVSIAGAGLVHLVEAVEDARQVFGRYRLSAVPHAHEDGVVLVAGAQQDLGSGRSEADGVVEEVREHLLDTPLVG